MEREAAGRPISEIFVLEYAASPDVYGEYWPIFDRLVTSFQFHDRPVVQGSEQP